MKANRVLAVALATAALAACAAPAPPPPRPAPVAPAQPRPAQPRPAQSRPAAAPAAAAPAPVDWRDAPQTPGTWRWANDAARSTARYAQPGQTAVAMLACEPTTRTTILWTSAALTEAVPMVLTTTGTRRVLTAEPATGGGAAVRLAARDALLDAIAFSRGRFMVEVAGFPALYLPAWPELSRVIEDCREG